MRLRPAVAGDLAALAALERASFGAAAWSEQLLEQELAAVPETRHVVVAEDPGGGLVGYGVLMAVGDTADVNRIGVVPDRRRSGLGSRLLAALIDEAVRRGCTQVLLELAENGAALALYERAGFTPVSRRTDYYGRGRDAVVMSCEMASRLR